MAAQHPPSRYYQYFVIFLIQALIAFMLFSYNKFNQASLISTNCQAPPVLEPNFTVLLWTWPFGEQFPIDKCPKPYDMLGCRLTANRSLYDTANAVVFHHREVCSSQKQMPQGLRPEGQYWVWFNIESPSHTPNLYLMDKLINLTMSYRSDSDIFTPYGWLVPNEADDNFKIPKKSQLVSWMVSNLNPSSRRVKFYEDFKNYIPIHVYGRQHRPLSRNDAYSVLSTYKFYLSFENTIHTDYITEKLWLNAFISGCVPVVLGPPRENYERYIPSDSFIHVDDFPSAKELASYLLELDKNDTKYQEYFRWRSKWKSVGYVSWSLRYCKACAELQKAPLYRTIPSIGKWFK